MDQFYNFLFLNVSLVPRVVSLLLVPVFPFSISEKNRLSFRQKNTEWQKPIFQNLPYGRHADETRPSSMGEQTEVMPETSRSGLHKILLALHSLSLPTSSYTRRMCAWTLRTSTVHQGTAEWQKPTTGTSEPWAPEWYCRAKSPTHPELSLNERQSLVVFSHCAGLLLQQLNTYLTIILWAWLYFGCVCGFCREPKTLRSFT